MVCGSVKGVVVLYNLSIDLSVWMIIWHSMMIAVSSCTWFPFPPAATPTGPLLPCMPCRSRSPDSPHCWPSPPARCSFPRWPATPSSPGRLWTASFRMRRPRVRSPERASICWFPKPAVLVFFQKARIESGRSCWQWRWTWTRASRRTGCSRGSSRCPRRPPPGCALPPGTRSWCRCSAAASTDAGWPWPARRFAAEGRSRSCGSWRRWAFRCFRCTSARLTIFFRFPASGFPSSSLRCSLTYVDPAFGRGPPQQPGRIESTWSSI